MPKPTSAAERHADAPRMRVVLLTMDHHVSSAASRAAAGLHQQLPGLVLSTHTAAAWRDDEAALQACRHDIASADHTFSQPAWQLQVEDLTLAWLGTMT